MILRYIKELNDIKKKHLYILLILIVILGFGLRYTPYLHKLSLGDTYYQFSIIESILEEGKAPNRLTLSEYPEGRNLKNSPLFLPYFIAISYKILQPLGISLANYMVIFPALFGSLAVIPLYFLAHELFDKRIAIMTALIYVILPASIDRTFAGFVEKESLVAITVFLWLYLFIKSKKELDLTRKSTFVIPIISGFFMTLSFYTWRGTSYFLMFIALTVLIQTIFKPNENLSLTTVIMTVSGFTLIHFVQPNVLSIENVFLSFRYAPLTYVSIIAVLAILPKHIENFLDKKIQPIQLVGLFFGIFVFIILLLNLQKEFINMLKSLFDLLFKSGSRSAVEAQSAIEQGYTFLRNPFSLMVSFVILGVYYFFNDMKKNLDFNFLFIAIWFITSAYAAYQQVRLSFILAPVASMIISYGFFRLLDIFIDESPPNAREQTKNKANLLIVILVLFILGTISSDIGFARGLNEYQSERINHWENAMAYVAYNTPEDSVVVAWWDYGYVIQGLGKRATITDPGGGGKRRKDVAKILTSDEDNAITLIGKYVEEDTPTYIIVSFEEFILANTINSLAKDNLYFFEHTIPQSGSFENDQKRIKDFVDTNKIEAYSLERVGGFWRIWFTGFTPLPDGSFKPDRNMKNKMLPKLLPFNTGTGKGLNHFRLVYSDKSNFIFIYEKV
jgi:dolichyl-diphosphooligosaccharide--protein glycosyltransferase